MCIYICTYTCIYTHIYIICTHTHTHAHKHACIRRHTFLDGYCSTVQGLLDWFEVDLGSIELLFIQIDLCVMCVVACDNTHTHTHAGI